MQDFLIYDAKVAVLIIVFYMFYRLLLSKETFHRVNRVVLLLTAVASFVLPLCVITMHKTVTVEAVPMVSVGNLQMEIADDAAPGIWQVVLPILFIIGVAATLGHTLASILKVMLLIRKSERFPQPDGTVLCVTGNAEVSPFSWMRYIIMNRSDYEARDAAILAHERGHIRLRHSCDVLLVDLLTALQWFNPAMWMLRQDLRAIHEYEADGEVLSQGINARQYQYLLISKAASIGGYSIANGINHSTLKNRITMMLHTKSSSRSYWKLLALLPIVGVTLALNAETITEVVYQNDTPQKQVPVKKGKKAGTIKMGSKQVKVVEQDKKDNTVDETVTETSKAKEVPANNVFQVVDVFDVVEQMPQFPGGMQALMEYLSQNIKYPKEAMEAEKQGRVLVQFIVAKDGSVKAAQVLNHVYDALDAEALRVVNAMPNWLPGRQNGKVVNVKYTVPISFRLQGNEKKEDAAQATNTEEVKREVTIITGKSVLFIVDGETVSLEHFKTIDPKTIDHMEVLKDKAAIEQYGEKGKDGVIIVTTK